MSLSRSRTESIIPFRESPETPYILFTPAPINDSTTASETFFARLVQPSHVAIILVTLNTFDRNNGRHRSIFGWSYFLGFPSTPTDNLAEPNTVSSSLSVTRKVT